MNVDLTGKLGLGGKPTVTIGDTVLVVDDSAPNILRIFDLIDDQGLTVQAVFKMSEMIFEKQSVKELQKLRLSFADYAEVVSTAVDMVVGRAEGEGRTRGTTS